MSSLLVSASIRVRMETATGRRTLLGVFATATPLCVAAFHIDVMEPGAELRDQRQPAVGVEAVGAHARAGKHERVRLFDLAGCDHGGGLHTRLWGGHPEQFHRAEAHLPRAGRQRSLQRGEFGQQLGLSSCSRAPRRSVEP
jgi:hypothetical protein